MNLYVVSYNLHHGKKTVGIVVTMVAASEEEAIKHMERFEQKKLHIPRAVHIGYALDRHEAGSVLGRQER